MKGKVVPARRTAETGRNELDKKVFFEAKERIEKLWDWRCSVQKSPFERVTEPQP